MHQLDHPIPQGEFSLAKDNFGRLVLTDAQGTKFVGVMPVHAFPFSEPTKWVSLVDDHGRELRMFESLDELCADNRSMLEAELNEREFLPQLLRIHTVVGQAPMRWIVDTDHGRTEFSVDAEEDIRLIEPHGCLIMDTSGIRYSVPDMRTLDSHSRKILDHCL